MLVKVTVYQDPTTNSPINTKLAQRSRLTHLADETTRRTHSELTLDALKGRRWNHITNTRLTSNETRTLIVDRVNDNRAILISLLDVMD